MNNLTELEVRILIEALEIAIESNFEISLENKQRVILKEKLKETL